MAKRQNSKDNGKGRRLAITILLGIFVAIMLTIFVNLTVSYFYEGPQYEKYCPYSSYAINEPSKIPSCYNCTTPNPPELEIQAKNCSASRGMAEYHYDSSNCPVSVSCNKCSSQFEDATKVYNRQVFFVFAVVGFALIIFGLFSSSLLLQIVALPSGAFLVIEAAGRNFDDKLLVIITFGLLIILALYLAIKKLKLN